MPNIFPFDIELILITSKITIINFYHLSVFIPFHKKKLIWQFLALKSDFFLLNKRLFTLKKKPVETFYS